MDVFCMHVFITMVVMRMALPNGLVGQYPRACCKIFLLLHSLAKVEIMGAIKAGTYSLVGNNESSRLYSHCQREI